MENLEIRSATTDDAQTILDIYKWYVTNTAITYEYDVPSLEEFRERISYTLKKYPYLVAVLNGEIVGYCYAGTFKSRAAYSRSCEVSIYVNKDLHRSGVGRALYTELEARLKAMGMLNMYACIAYPEVEDEYLTKNSPDFHAHTGFSLAGRYHKCAYKFGRWYDMVWMEKLIGEHV